jgi:hypothetical protein
MSVPATSYVGPPPPPPPSRATAALPAAARTNTLAIVSLVSALVLPGLGSLAAIVLGHVALGQIRTSGEQGRGMALAGLILGYASLLLILVVLAVLLFFTVHSVGEAPFVYSLK